MLVERRAHSHLRPPTRASLDHASLLFDGLLPPWHHAHIAYAGAVLPVNRHERMHPVVASPLPEVSSAENPRLTVRWPIISMPLPEGPGNTTSVDYFDFLPLKPRGNAYILLFTDRFRRRADTFAVTAAEFTAEGTVNILVIRYVPPWWCPRTLLSDNGLQVSSKLLQAVYRPIGSVQGCHKLLSS